MRNEILTISAVVEYMQYQKYILLRNFYQGHAFDRKMGPGVGGMSHDVSPIELSTSLFMVINLYHELT